MNMVMQSVSMPSCVNPAIQAARETVGASLLLAFYLLFMGASRHLSLTRANITVFIHPGVVDIGYFYRFCLSVVVSLVIYGVLVL